MTRPVFQNKVKRFEKVCDAPPDYGFTVKYGPGSPVAVPSEGVVLVEIDESGAVLPDSHKVLSREAFEEQYEEVPAP